MISDTIELVTDLDYITSFKLIVSWGESNVFSLLKLSNYQPGK